ncbi:MAG: OmpA family protein [Desulfocapsaceae bacterium]|nr:OmpA family protein [Desulfocapsaceae bacterium]
MSFSTFLKRIAVVGVCCLLPATISQAEEVNLLSLQEGCIPVVKPPCYGGWDAQNVLDDSPASGWACEQGKISGNVFVFEMAAEATLQRLEFDTASIDTTGSAAKEITVEVSNTSATEGYQLILHTTLADKTDGQQFPVIAKVPGRWLRLTLVSNYGSPEYIELFSFKGYGEKPSPVEVGNIAGTYNSDYANFHVQQEGTALNGCYEYNDGLITGSIEGKVMKLTWREGENTGPALMVFADDSKSFQGFWWRKGLEQGAPAGTWNGTKTSTQVGGCPHWSGSLGGELKKQLDSTGRARIYGIRFALNSAAIDPASLPILHEVLQLLQSEPALKLSIEGHTDSTGTAERNQTLSQQRAESVKGYLVGQGIVADRLTTAGFGSSVSVADNNTELGRAQNRRVELVRQ